MVGPHKFLVWACSNHPHESPGTSRRAARRYRVSSFRIFHPGYLGSCWRTCVERHCVDARRATSTASRCHEASSRKLQVEKFKENDAASARLRAEGHRQRHQFCRGAFPFALADALQVLGDVYGLARPGLADHHAMISVCEELREDEGTSYAIRCGYN